jgi:single-strand DNA-binding protein
MNNIVISGRLTKDPECKELENGKTVCDFVIAVNGYKKNDTMFIKAKAWDNRAKNCSKYCAKGSLVNVSGALKENVWKDKEGNNRKEFYILANEIEFVQKPNSESKEPEPVAQQEKPTVIAEDISEEDLEEVPF